MSKKYRLEDDLFKKTIPRYGSGRYDRLMRALRQFESDQYAKGKHLGFPECERCGKMLLNPQSILLHQGGFCRKRIENAAEITIDQIAEILRNLNLKS